MGEWILNTMNVETFDYNTEAWVGEAISKGMRRHPKAKCFNCGRIGHLKRNCSQEFLGIMPPLGMARTGRLSLLVYVGGVAKVNIGSIECRSTKERQGNPIPSGNSLGSLSQASMSNMVQPSPVNVDNTSHQEN